MMNSFFRSASIRSSRPHQTLHSSLLSWSNDNLLRRILPISLLLVFSFSTLPVVYAQKEQDSLRIDDPSPPPQQCGSFTLSWSGGVSPYTLLIRNATDDSHTILRVPFNGTENTTVTWFPVDVYEGTKVFAEVVDSTSNKTRVGPLMVLNGDDGCLTSSVSSTTSPTSSTDSASTTLAIPIPSLSSTPGPTTSSPSSSSSQKSVKRLSAGAIAGIAVGLAILILLAAGAFLYFRRRRRGNGGAAAELIGGAKYRAARNSAGPFSKVAEQPVTFWDANMFVRDKPATTQQG
ncbi:hypothetical protein V8D89_000977 [Ganoderma adspersum]